MNAPGRGPGLAQSYAAAARVVAAVLDGGNASAALDARYRRGHGLRAAAQDLSYRTLRAYGTADVIVARLLDTPAEPGVRALLQVAIADLCSDGGEPRAPHAVVHQAVEAASLLQQGRARGLVNAVLRAFLRRRTELLAQAGATNAGRWHHPPWWVDRMRTAYPGHWESILGQSNAHPPMGLRVNLRRNDLETYRARLEAAGMASRRVRGVPAALVLESPVPVQRLPGFDSGEVSVQDPGAQLAAPLLAIETGMTVLDACAAPGGKTAHALESVDCEMTAMDVSAERAARIHGAMQRLGLRCRVVVADAADPAAAGPLPLFDRILLDAPCTASGVSRRYPDVRWLRRDADVAAFARQQRALLECLWGKLKPGGRLLYATCSLFPEENGLQIEAFMAEHADARRLDVDLPPGAEAPLPGLMLPGPDNDGFFYALLAKRTGRARDAAC